MEKNQQIILQIWKKEIAFKGGYAHSNMHIFHF